MVVNVAGAGAGKTTKMADIIMGHGIPDGKVAFCIAFTNAAADNIKEKVERKLNGVPNNIKISTIHSFLYHELIEPYYYFLYGQQFRQLSTIKLPDLNRYKAAKLSELKRADILHITKIPEKAKWVAYQKSGDTKKVKSIRKRILARFNDYCSAIYVDEAQDINKDIYDVLSSLENAGVEIILYGDPKQDVKGYGCFRRIIDESSDVHYYSDCYRCPQAHLDLSNELAPPDEKQVASAKNAVGSLSIVFESDIKNLKEYIESANYGLCYISQKRGHFCTHGIEATGTRFETLHNEVFCAMEEKWRGEKTEIEIKRAAFFVTEKILNGYNYFKKALELDTIKDKKGKIKPRYSREISELLVQYAYTLYRSGAIAYNGKKFYPDAYTGFVAGADIAGNIMPENAVTTGTSTKVSPLFTDSLRALSYFYAGVSAYTADRQDEAMKAFADSERMNPRNSDMYVYMMSLLEKKILKDSVSTSVHILADSLLAVSKRAYKLFGISNPLFLRRTVDILNRKGDSLESLDILNRQIELTPDSAFLYGLRAVTNELLAKDDDALLDYQRAAEKKGVSSSILLRGAYKYYEIGADRKNKIEGTRKQKAALRKAVLTDFMYPALELAKRAKEMSSDAQEKRIIDNLLENIDYDISVLK